MLEKKFWQQALVPDYFSAPTADATLTVRDLVVRPSASAPMTITLPSVSEAAGLFISIVARAADLVNTITIQDQDDSEAWGGDYVMQAAGDYMLLYSDGFSWIPIAQSLTV
jgi:hypothetical protein